MLWLDKKTRLTCLGSWTVGAHAAPKHKPEHGTGTGLKQINDNEPMNIMRNIIFK